MFAEAICIKRYILKVDEIEILIEKYLSGDANAAERATVEKWYERVGGEEGLFSVDEMQEFRADMSSAIFSHISKHTEKVGTPIKTKVRFLQGYVKWAAAILIIGLGAGIFYYSVKPDATIESANQLAREIRPGGNKAILTLSDGTTLVLDSANQGQIATISGISIQKNEEGLLSYHANESTNTESLVYNTITIPRGGKYIVQLADGTKIWLNSASTLKYPIAFPGQERSVELSGEAYFEVAKNLGKPFRVTSNGQTVEVLGTHFNVNGYTQDKETITTLLEGKVKISKGKQNAILEPGQQSLTGNEGFDNDIQIIDNVNMAEVIAWKNDLFQFENADIRTIMNQIGRWYDMEIVYEKQIADGHYRGKVSRNSNLSTALKILETSGINFKIEGRKIIVK